MASRVTERGQITIGLGIRKQLGVKPGMVAHQRAIDGRLEVVFLPAPHRSSQFGVFHRKGERPGPATRDDIEDAVRQAIAEEQHRDGKGDA